MKKLHLLVFMVFLTFLVNAGTITISSPNGGEVWAGCTSHLVTWNSSGVSNNYNIDYSINNGASWISVASSLYITNGQYNWTVPNVSSTSCLIRVSDASAPATNDVNNATFSITAPLLLIVPNGGESWEGGTSHIINFAASGTTNYYDLFYSVNAGGAWTSIVSNQYITNGQYNWSVPNNPSTSTLIKIQDHTNTTCMVDVSDNLFTITPATPSITVTYPNSNITAYVGSTMSINWTSAYVISNALKIDYSTNNGSTWTPVVTNTTNTGSYTWTVPNTPSTQCLVKVTDLGNPATFDVSNTTFTIALPYITLLTPNGTESWGGCSTQSVTWTSGGTSGTFVLKYSTDNGLNWNSITSVSGSSYSWAVPSLSSNQCRVKINDASNTAIKDSSNAVFTIIPNSDIVVMTPNGSESWQVGTTQTINWVSSPTSTRFNVYYSTNGGAAWTTIATYLSGQSTTWTIPNYPGNNCLIKVEDYNNTCKFDVSNATFTIAPPAPIITVTSPNSAVTWYSGNTNTISWTSAYLTSSFVKIEYSTNAGSTWTVITATTQNNGTYSWTVPATFSTQCKVRVSEFNNAIVNDVSDVNFTIAVPYITVTSPNGTENWLGCSTQNITWNSAGTSGTFNIKYSTNNGTNWTVLTSSTSGSSFSWNPVISLPSTSANCLVKVTDASNTAYVDSSNAKFTLTQNTDVVVTSPNGTETWIAGATQTITWVSAPTSTRFNVYYSSNGGTSWTTIATYLTGQSTTFAFPNTPGNNYVVKVEDYNNTCKYDVSNAAFTISSPPPAITVTYPNSASIFYIGGSTSINWTTAYLTTNYVKIEYTTNGGTSWSVISAMAQNNGTYGWTIPAPASTQCKVKVSDYYNASTFDVSDVNFTIANPFISVTSPNGTENWLGCSTQNITWNSGGTSGTFTIKYSTTNGTNWTTLASGVSGSSYSWNPVTSLSSTNCLVKVSDYNNAVFTDSSNAVFTLTPNTDIIVTSPNGTENWQVGTTQTITWAAAPTSTRFNVYYSSNNGAAWTTIATYLAGLSTTWLIPNSPGNAYLIKVEDYNNTCKYDVSNAVFTVSPPKPVITVTSPNSGVTWYSGTTYTINWSTAYLTTNYMKIEYSTNAGSTWSVIAGVATNNGSYSWLVPSTPSAQCRVKVSDYNNLATFDISDVNFTIANPFITVTSPNGTESWKGCSSKIITWTSGGTSGTFYIKYSTNNGSTWSTITSASGSSYTWGTVPNTASTQCFVKVSDYSNNSITDSSNAVFTIVNNADITVTTPNGTESWQVGTSQSINWVSEPTTTRYNVYYSTNNGTAWTSISSYITGLIQAWTIPNYPSTTSLVKVEDYNNTCIYDVSNAVFTIAPPSPYINVTSPNSAVTWYTGSLRTINWSSQYLTSSFVKIEYTSNNGTSWNQIASPVQNTGSYTWTVPNTPSTQCKVRISEYNNPVVFDISDVNFIIAVPFITINSPNGGESYEGCTNQSVTFSAAGTTGSYIMKYSTDNGVSWISGGSASGSPFSWTTIPNISSTQCRVKIYDASNAAIVDSSNATFSIVQNNDVIITSPNGGESWQVATTHNITWVSDPTSTAFMVSYSSNNGSTWTQITSYTTSHTVSWTIPNNPGGSYKIRVDDYNNTCKTDMNDALFAVTPQVPAVTSPNGGETRYYGSNYNITWTNQYFNSTYVRIDLSVDSGFTWTPIASVTNNSGSYSWACPNTYSNKCLVKVSEYNNPTAYDISDAVFTIAPGMVITSPNGDNGSEEWRVCTLTTLKWTSGGGSGTYKLEYSTNNGSTWIIISSSVSVGGTNCTYDWTIPNTPSTQCLFRVTDNSYSLKTDVSDATFTIKPSLTVVTPNGGQSLTVGSVYNITWTQLGASNYYDIDYSTNGGTNWTSIIFNQFITSNTYAWTVPTVASTNCFIRITDHINTCKTDLSNNSFSIGMPSPTIAITSPNGGETLNSCATTNISWNSSSTSNIFNIEYTKDNGVTWNTIISNYSTMSGTYAWTVPNVASNQCLIRVKDYNNNSISDVSNAMFTINPTVTATITAGGPTTFCAGGSVILTSSSASNNLWSPGGQTTQSITVSSTGAYSVVVTNAGCSATSNTVNVTVNPIPTAPVATSNSPVALNGTIQLYASTVPNASYSWTGPLSFTSVLQNPSRTSALQTMSGTYSVIANVSGCNSAAGTVSVTVTSTPATATVAGTVMNETGSVISGVTLDRTGTGSPASFVTSADGQYNFTMNIGSSYVVTPSKSNDVVTNNGISTLDIILTQRHILGTATLNSAYKIIAADVNKSGSVSSLDLVLMRSVILQSATSFPNNQLWAFVNSSYSFPDVMNPFPYESTRSYSSASAMTDQNFIGVKLGDVNNSWDNHTAKSGPTGNLYLSMSNISAAQGDEIIVPVKVSAFSNISGYQLSMTWNPNELEYLSANNSSVTGFYNTDQVSSGKLTSLWSTENLSGMSLSDGSTIFELRFKIIGQAGNTTNISVNSSMTKAEAYDAALNELAIVSGDATLIIENPTVVTNFDSQGYVLYQNSPNPFNGNTEIRFALPNDEKVLFTIYNYLGEAVMQIIENYGIGTHSINWDGKDKSGSSLSSGTYFIRMEAGRYVGMKKMILIE